MIFDAEKIQSLIGYRFKDINLLKTAFTHKSYHGSDFKTNNERLEFLGDSLLGFVIADYLYSKKKRVAEGVMTKEKQALVSTKPLASAVRTLKISEYIIQGQSLNYDASSNDRLLENLFEALVAAIYLDGGFSCAEKFIKDNFGEMIDLKSRPHKDYKTALQEEVHVL